MLSIRWAHLLRRLILLLGVYFLLRLLFFFCNHHLFAGLGFGRIAEAFGYGLRFDLSALVAINFPFIVLTFLPPALEPRPAYERLLKGVFLLLNVPFLVINIIDLEYFHFTGRRSTLQLLGVAGDAGVKFSTLALYYWPLVLLGLFLIALVFVLYGKSSVAARPAIPASADPASGGAIGERRPMAVELMRRGKQPAPSGRHVYSIETAKGPELRRSDMEREHAAPMGLLARLRLVAINMPLLTELCAHSVLARLKFPNSRAAERRTTLLSGSSVLGQGTRRTDRKDSPASLWLWALNLLLIVPLSVVIFRGGLQWRPISPAQAMVLHDSALAQLALNSSFTVLKSYKKNSLVRRHYFNGRDELLQYLQPLVGGGERLIPEQSGRDNIVILILESFSAEYWGAGHGGDRYTPFLDSLARESLFFQRHYANGRASIEVMPSVLAGLPSLMDEPFMESVYQSNEILGLGTVLANHGYTTSFFHGGKNGTMRFDVFMHLAGMRHYAGLNEYPHPEDYDGNWGIYDEPFLQFVAAELGKQKPPFATAIFTVSSHHPYPIPAKYRGRFKKGTLPIHESIGYTDYAVEQFFAAARQQPWYTNTLFIITADHTQKLETPEYLNALGHYRVPLMVFHPLRKFPNVDTTRVVQQADIFPSILDYLQIKPERRLLFGRSIFRSGDGRAFLHVNGHYWLVRGQQALEFVPGADGGNFYDLAQDPQLKSPIAGQVERRLALENEAKALVQYYNNGMLDNDLYVPMQ